MNRGYTRENYINLIDTIKEVYIYIHNYYLIYKYRKFQIYIQKQI